MKAFGTAFLSSLQSVRAARVCLNPLFLLKPA